jgi:hypothetical protein
MILKEITKWECEFQPNHTYKIKNEKIVAYKKFHEGPWIVLKYQPRFNRSRRKFITLKDC